jgi:hypothetical protein
MLDRVSEEMEAARFAIIQTIGAVDREATWARLAEQARVGRGELLRCRANLETTFLLRLFAEFEAILRDYWRQGLHRRKQPDVSVLIGRVAAYRRVPDKHPDHLGVDEVREYRNDLVHEQIRVARLTFEQCLSRIGRFLRWLPAEW